MQDVKQWTDPGLLTHAPNAKAVTTPMTANSGTPSPNSPILVTCAAYWSAVLVEGRGGGTSTATRFAKHLLV